MVGVPREATVLTLFEAPGWLAVEGIFILCTLFPSPSSVPFFTLPNLFASMIISGL